MYAIKLLTLHLSIKMLRAYRTNVRHALSLQSGKIWQRKSSLVVA